MTAAAVVVALEAVLTNPEVDAEILAAIKVVRDFFVSMTPAAVAAQEQAAKQDSADKVTDFVTGSAADLADAQARLAALEGHPVVIQTGLAATVATLRAELAERVK